MVYDKDVMGKDPKWMKELKKFATKHKWTKSETIKYFELTAKSLETEISTKLQNDDDFLASLDSDGPARVLSEDDILSETIILSQDGEGHN